MGAAVGQDDLLEALRRRHVERAATRVADAARAGQAGSRSQRATYAGRVPPHASARRKPSSGIHDAGSQPQPGLSSFCPASSDCRVSHSGSTSRSGRGPRSASASGGAWPETKKPEPRRATMRAFGDETVVGFDDGRFGHAKRLAHGPDRRHARAGHQRAAGNALAQAVHDGFDARARRGVGVSSCPCFWKLTICTAPCTVQFARIVLLRSLHFYRRRRMLAVFICRPSERPMKPNATSTAPHRRPTDGWLSGLLGVLIFSGSLPATRIAVQGLDPIFLTVARAPLRARSA